MRLMHSIKAGSYSSIQAVCSLLNMDKVHVLLVVGLMAVFCFLASADNVATDKPKTYVDRSNGVETSIPGTTVPQEPQGPRAQSVPNYISSQGGNTVLQNEAGSIFTRSDGKTVLIGSGGQTIVTDGDSDEDDSDIDDNDDNNFGGHNVIINGDHQHSFSSNGGVFLSNSGGEGSSQFFNNYQVNVVNGGLQLKMGGQVYDFKPKGAGVKSEERVTIDGKEATVHYDNGNIVVELADGTVFAKTEEGLFSGNRESYMNRAQIKQDALNEAARVQQQFADVQNRIQAQMRELEANLQHTLNNIRF